MENPSYIALSQQMALRRQMDVIATNIANASTPGFKAERIMFAELVAGKAPYPFSGTIGTRPGLSFVSEMGMLRDTTDGGMTQTGNTLDLAISGPGYFAVETPAGTRYTRQGAFRLDQDGRIVTVDGYPLLDAQDRPISIRPGETRIEISTKGAVTTESGEVGRIQIAQFEDEQAMRKIGAGLYETDQDPVPGEIAAEIRQGMLEGSNVKAVTEVTSMMEILRRYQSAQKIIDSEHELERRAIEKLSRMT
ncbi:MAG TPA: flagellar basal-body rod protein FlgF [Alphaproteobacteria bacterium]|nr:flagellar basal-body rod protein FlgF [Alphaproteobacteria bacterium]